MFLKNLKLTNFRNFSKVDLDFGNATLLVGNNAQGKTNLLESIYFLATSKSPRADKDVQLIKDGEEFVRVEGEVGNQSSVRQLPDRQSSESSSNLRFSESNDLIAEDSVLMTSLEIFMQKTAGSERLEKRTKVNGIGRRSTDYIGNLVVIHFSPEDINLVTGAPALRRWHLDLTLAQIDRDYKNALNTYHTSLISKNKILKGIKEGVARVDELEFWNGQMVFSGNLITQKRQAFFSFLNSNGSEGSLGNFRFIYEESLISESRIREYLAREIAAGNSLVGPHRDDFVFKIDSKDLEYFGSRGEQRTAVLELKLAELQFIKQFKNVLPILLLDDVFSELDTAHRQHVISAVDGQQTIISAVENEQIPESFLKKVQVINVEKGKLISASS
ncbi:MAG: DNA replication and repair protein RecF [Candidatus Daviesbacteria bacterium]|nr:DNA replication and repair protein RecF [Candidatus Daviesbacteria bacterium]